MHFTTTAGVARRESAVGLLRKSLKAAGVAGLASAGIEAIVRLTPDAVTSKSVDVAFAPGHQGVAQFAGATINAAASNSAAPVAHVAVSTNDLAAYAALQETPKYMQQPDAFGGITWNFFDRLSQGAERVLHFGSTTLHMVIGKISFQQCADAAGAAKDACGTVKMQLVADKAGLASQLFGDKLGMVDTAAYAVLVCSGVAAAVAVAGLIWQSHKGKGNHRRMKYKPT